MNAVQTQSFTVQHRGVPIVVVVKVDFDWLAKLYVRRALSNKSRVANLANRAVTVSVLEGAP